MYKGRYPAPPSKASRAARRHLFEEKDNKTAAQKFVDRKIAQYPVMLFSKTYTPECKIIKEALAKFELRETDYCVTEIEKRQDVIQIENYFQVLCLTNNRAVPQLWIHGKYIGGYEEILRMIDNKKLAATLRKTLLID